jgi:hypothetical protein
MSDVLSDDQLRTLYPFLFKDTDVLLFENGEFKKATISVSAMQNEVFAKNATDWEKNNCPLLTGSNKWKAIIDSAQTIVAYTSIIDNTGVYHFVIRDINGVPIVDQTVGEKPLEPDAWGDTLFATIVTLGGALVVRSIAAGIASVATAAIASGARVVSLAVARILAGETTEGVVLTALRSIRAQAIVKALQARSATVIVNVGGEAGSEEIAKWGADQIALNHQVRMGIAKRFVPNLVKENGEKIGEVFGQNTIDQIVSRRLDASFDVNKFARGAFRVLKPGGTIEMQIYSNDPMFAAAFRTALQNAGFKNVGSEFNVVFRAVR